MKPLTGHVGGGQSTWPFPSVTFDPRGGIFHGEAFSHQGKGTREMYIGIPFISIKNVQGQNHLRFSFAFA